MADLLDTVKAIRHRKGMDDLPPDHRPHHHGNLREALIDAGLALLAEGGLAGLTLRRAAAAAGVSHAAPAHHFDGLPGLLTAIAARAFQRFADQMEGSRQAAPPDAMGRLKGICQGYLTFADRHSALFHLMFNSPSLDRSDAQLVAESNRAYLILRDACLSFAIGPYPDEVLETAVWSLVHGYALLGFSNPSPGSRAATSTPDFGRLLETLIRGHVGPDQQGAEPLACRAPP